MIIDSVALELPTHLYDQLQALAAEDQSDPVAVLEHLVTQAHQHRRWQHTLTALRAQIQEDGGVTAGATQAEVVERLRQTRHEIFDAEYAHLYR